MWKEVDHSNMENRNVFPNIKAVRNWSPTKDNHTFFHFWSKVLCQIGGGGGGWGKERTLVLYFCFQAYPNLHKLSKTWLFYSEILNRKSNSQ